MYSCRAYLLSGEFREVLVQQSTDVLMQRAYLLSGEFREVLV